MRPYDIRTLNKRFQNWMTQCRQTHNNRYQYEKTDYLNMRTKVKVTCKAHGAFWTFPQSHLQGSGCPNCGKHKTTNTSTTPKKKMRRTKLKLFWKIILPDDKVEQLLQEEVASNINTHV